MSDGDLMARVHERRRRSGDEAAHRAELWGDDGRAAMTRLCRSLPSLAQADGVEPWDALAFLRWSAEGAHLTAGSLMAVRFVLQVWNMTEDWRTVAAELGVDGGHLAPFNAVEAISRWDHEHRDAFLAWCEIPFLP